MYYFWIAVVVVGVTTRLLSMMRGRRHYNKSYEAISEVASSTDSVSLSPVIRLQTWLKRYLTTPAAFGDRCSRPYGWCTIPRLPSSSSSHSTSPSVLAPTVLPKATSTGQRSQHNFSAMYRIVLGSFRWQTSLLSGFLACETMF